MSYLTNPYRFTVAAQVIWSADFTGSGGYQVYRTETSTLPVSGDTYFFGTNNNGGGGGCDCAFYDVPCQAECAGGNMIERFLPYLLIGGVAIYAVSSRRKRR